MKGFHSTYDKGTPEQHKKIFAEFAEVHISSKAGKAKYNPETFVIEQEDSYVVENLTILSEQDLQNPHIKFFVERNPGWRKVHHNLLLYCFQGRKLTNINNILIVDKNKKRSIIYFSIRWAEWSGAAGQN